MFRHFLFETKFGNWLLAVFERHTGLALVSADWLAEEESCEGVKNE